MGVKIRKRSGKWYVFVNYHGRRKAKCVGASRQAAEEVRRQLEARLALGDVGFMSESASTSFRDYADRWRRQHAELKCKPSTLRGYDSVLRLYLFPALGNETLQKISRDKVKQLFADSASRGFYQAPPQHIVGIIGEGNGGQNGNDGNDDHDLDQGEACVSHAVFAGIEMHC